MKNISILVAGLLAAFSAGAAQAATVSYSFAGVTSNHMGSIAAGTPFTGTFSYDSSVAGVTTPYNSNIGIQTVFANAFSNLSMTIGGKTVTENAPGPVVLYHDPYPKASLLGLAPGDSLSTTSAWHQLPLPSNGSFTGYTPIGFSLQLIDLTSYAFGANQQGRVLPTSLSLKNFTWGQISVYDSLYVTTSNLISLTPIAAVPEPGTWAMMIAGLGILGAAARRKA